MASSGLDTHTDWLFTLTEAKELAQQHSEGGIRQLYWRLKATLAGPKSPRHEAEMVDYLLATRAAQILPSAPVSRTPLDWRHESARFHASLRVTGPITDEGVAFDSDTATGLMPIAHLVAGVRSFPCS
jgi:hypothetical protein